MQSCPPPSSTILHECSAAVQTRRSRDARSFRQARFNIHRTRWAAKIPIGMTIRETPCRSAQTLRATARTSQSKRLALPALKAPCGLARCALEYRGHFAGARVCDLRDDYLRDESPFVEFGRYEGSP